jgi:hypothetical protein
MKQKAEGNQYSEAELATNDQEVTGAAVVFASVKRKETSLACGKCFLAL